MPVNISLPELLDAALTARLRSVHTSLPATIRSYSEANQNAQVELAVHLEVTAERFERVPNLVDVPVLWPGAWTNGDKCLVVFSEEDPSKWWESGSVEPPAILQRHGLHAVVIPIVAEAGQAVQFVALANLVTAQFESLKSVIAAWQVALAAVAPPSTPITAALLATAVDGLVTLLDAWPTAAVAAAKVKAR